MRGKTQKQARHRAVYAALGSQAVLSLGHDMPVSVIAPAQAERPAASDGAAYEVQTTAALPAAYAPYGGWNGFDRAGDAGGANRRAALPAESLSRFRDVW